MAYGIWITWPKKGWYSDEPVRADLPRRLLLQDSFQVYNDGRVVSFDIKEDAEAWAKICREDRNGIAHHGGKYSVREIAGTSTSNYKRRPRFQI